MELDVHDIIRIYNEYRSYHDVTELCHMMKKNDCDKGLGFHNYSTFYHQLFQKVRHESFRFIEIGYNKHGVSLPAWREYFSKATIYGADVESLPEISGIEKIISFDQKSPEDICRLFEEIGHVDVILDDGIHDYESNMTLFTNAFPFLNNGGIYIIEDLKKETRDMFENNRIEMMSRYQLDMFHIMDIPYHGNQYDNRVLIMRKHKRLPLTIITAASQNHAKSLIQFICSIIVNKVPFEDIYIYDLGLDEITMRILKDMFPSHNVHIRSFDYSKYPDYFNIKDNAGQYAWKPVIIEEVAHELKKGLLLWCDAGNKAMDNMQTLIQHMKKNAIYSPISIGTVRQWTHPKTLEYLSIQSGDPLNEYINRNAAQICFNLNSNVMNLIEEWAHCAKIRACIAPPGSDRTNHRQDQSIFTILFYRFIKKYPQEIKNDYVVQIHQDID